MPRLTLAALFRSLTIAPALRQSASTTPKRTITTLLTTPSRPTSHLLRPHPTTTTLTTALTSPILQQIRGYPTYGQEYQPSQRKRKRKHGFLARQRGGKDGLAMLRRRRRQGRRFLSH